MAYDPASRQLFEESMSEEEIEEEAEMDLEEGDDEGFEDPDSELEEGFEDSLDADGEEDEG